MSDDARHDIRLLCEFQNDVLSWYRQFRGDPRLRDPVFVSQLIVAFDSKPRPEFIDVDRAIEGQSIRHYIECELRSAVFAAFTYQLVSGGA